MIIKKVRGMKTKLISAGCLVASLVVLLAAVVIAPLAAAQSGGNVTGGGATTNKGYGDSFRISPLRTDVTINPGETRKVTIYIQNLNPVPATLKPINNDFIAGNKEDGTPDIILNENEYAPTHSLKRFMAPIPNVAVGPGERKPVEVTISVPSTAQAGGYYGALRFAPALADGSGSVSVTGSVASLILMTVPGDLVENLTLKDFTLQQKGKESKRFSSPKGIKAVVRLQNKGNVHIAPQGGIFVQKGDKVIYQAKINDIKPAGVVLPDSTRKWEIPVKKLGNFGKYKITAVIGYGATNKTINIERTIWIIPTLYIVGAILALIAIIGVIFAITMSLRAYKRRILRGARRR